MAGDIKKLEGIQVIIFDAYGTLFDVASAVNTSAAAVGEKAGELSKLWRAKQLEYTWIRSLVGAHADFWQVSRDALDFAMEALQISEAGLADELMSGLLALEPFADAVDAVKALRARSKRLAILSNGSPSMLDAMTRRVGWDKTFEYILSVEDVGIYKPSRRVYRLAMQKFGLQDAPSVCFVSGNGWDAHSAAQFGFQAVRIKRAIVPDDRLPGKLAATVASLEELSGLV